LKIAAPKAPLLCRLQNNRVMAVTVHPDLAALDRLKTRIQGLRAKTTDNGCTEAEALLAAVKVAELLDRYDLSLTDVEIRNAQCEQREYETPRKKRIPLDDCIGAIANFCDCRVWREKNPAGESRYVFFGLRSDIEVAHYLTELIDNRAVRARPLQEFGRLPPFPAPGPLVPIERAEPLQEGGGERLGNRVVFASHEHAEASQPVALLRLHSDGPSQSRCATRSRRSA